MNVWKGTTYERFFSSANEDGIEGKYWTEVIKDSDNLIIGSKAGILQMFEVIVNKLASRDSN